MNEIRINAIDTDTGRARWVEVMNALVALGASFTVTATRRDLTTNRGFCLDAVIHWGTTDGSS